MHRIIHNMSQINKNEHLYSVQVLIFIDLGVQCTPSTVLYTVQYMLYTGTVNDFSTIPVFLQKQK